MPRVAVINIVALSTHLITPEHTPFLHEYFSAHPWTTLNPLLPSVTTTVQSSILTGTKPSEHGIVGNGWYSREDSEIKFWKQSNNLVQGDKIWHVVREKGGTVCNSFWWYNMYSRVDYSVTPRPSYPADGRKIPDCYAHPHGLRDELQQKLGQFPLFSFWGPNANIESSTWIAEAAMYLEEKYNPTLHLIYLPHLDYCLQKFGDDTENTKTELRQIDDLLKKLVSTLEAADVNVILLSEYGISPVNKPVHINRKLREAGLIAVRNELGREILDPGASRAFAVADHQIAHVYINDPTCHDTVRDLLTKLDGVAKVLDSHSKAHAGLDHERSGDLVCLSETEAWFTYYYWLDDNVCPDFARCVDIHRKPGYDPVELFLDPKIYFPMLKVGWKILKKEMGFRYLMDVIPLDATLVKGSHGVGGRRGVVCAEKLHGVDLGFVEGEKLIGTDKHGIEATDVYSLILKTLGYA